MVERERDASVTVESEGVNSEKLSVTVTLKLREISSANAVCHDFPMEKYVNVLESESLILQT